jgi:4'-phosphopantetheinyl transferase
VIQAPPYRVHVLEASSSSEEGVRRLLADELGVSVAEVELRRSRYGRPEIAAPRTHLRFSLARSGGRALIALAYFADIGVDVERTDRDTTGWTLWTQVLTQAELAALPQERARRNDALLRLWVAKEAILKAAGVGLSVDPRLVALRPSGQVASVPRALGNPGAWWLDFLEFDGLTASVALRRSPRAEVERSQLSDELEATSPSVSRASVAGLGRATVGTR